VDFDYEGAGLDRPSVINCDGLHTITKASLTTHAGSVSEATMERICAAVSYALGC
jgi:mRNA-degrading endonuclease toxin of MazEF toxin-antitoxin module